MYFSSHFLVLSLVNGLVHAKGQQLQIGKDICSLKVLFSMIRCNRLFAKEKLFERRNVRLFILIEAVILIQVMNHMTGYVEPQIVVGIIL